MKSSLLAVGAMLLTAVAAQPHKHQHRHQHHQKRDLEVVWETDWVVVTETVEMTTTVYVDGDATTTASATAAAEFFQTVSLPAPVAKTTSSSTSSSSSSSSSSVYVAPPAPTTSSSVYVPPPPPPSTSTTSTSVYVAPPPPPSTSTTSTSIYVAPPAPDTPTPSPTPTPVTTSQAPPVSTSAPSTGYSGACSASSPCEGDITYYQAGLGACGTTNNGDDEMVIALPHGLMGTQSNGNPYCGKTVTISHGGKTITATVVDKCMGCTGNSIDLSNKAFSALADFSVGRTTAEWWFN